MSETTSQEFAPGYPPKAADEQPAETTETTETTQAPEPTEPAEQPGTTAAAGDTADAGTAVPSDVSPESPEATAPQDAGQAQELPADGAEREVELTGDGTGEALPPPVDAEAVPQESEIPTDGNAQDGGN